MATISNDRSIKPHRYQWRRASVGDKPLSSARLMAHSYHWNFESALALAPGLMGVMLGARGVLGVRSASFSPPHPLSFHRHHGRHVRRRCLVRARSKRTIKKTKAKPAPVRSTPGTHRCGWSSSVCSSSSSIFFRIPNLQSRAAVGHFRLRCLTRPVSFGPKLSARWPPAACLP